MDEWLGSGKARVILPITDPYVVHHGALGSFATVYLEEKEDIEAAAGRLAALEGVEYVGTRAQAAERFELPPERLGDLVVVSGRHTVLGKAPGDHDLSLLEGGLRSHGGLAEQEVPFVLNGPLNPEYRGRAEKGLRNFDLFDFAINGVK